MRKLLCQAPWITLLGYVLALHEFYKQTGKKLIINGTKSPHPWIWYNSPFTESSLMALIKSYNYISWSSFAKFIYMYFIVFVAIINDA